MACKYARAKLLTISDAWVSCKPALCRGRLKRISSNPFDDVMKDVTTPLFGRKERCCNVSSWHTKVDLHHQLISPLYSIPQNSTLGHSYRGLADARVNSTSGTTEAQRPLLCVMCVRFGRRRRLSSSHRREVESVLLLGPMLSVAEFNSRH